MKIYKTEKYIEKGNSLYIFTERGCTHTEAEHQHDFIEIVYVLGGEADELVDDRCYRVRHGDMIFINYGSTHSFVARGEYSYVNICFSPEVVGDAIVTAENAFSLLSLTAFHEMCREADEGLISFFGEERRQIEQILDAMLEECHQRQTSWQRVMESYLNILITRMLRQVERGVHRGELNDTWRELLEYIDRNPGAELTLSALAQKCFYNPSYFSRVFKEKFGMSPGAYVSRKRAEHAAGLLCESELSIEKIGEQSGFSDRSSFYHAFAKHLGMTPAEYRRVYGKVKKNDK